MFKPPLSGGFVFVLRNLGVQVFRVVTGTRDHRGAWVVEKGPWLTTKRDAEYWADRLYKIGYRVSIEELGGSLVAATHGIDDDLAAALASLA